MSRNIKLAVIVIIGLFIAIFASTHYLKKEASDLIPPAIDTNVSPAPSPSWFKKPSNPEEVRCPADVKKCPNGSYVGRVAPSCAFAPCPRGIQK